jgi:hypothetical protein
MRKRVLNEIDVDCVDGEVVMLSRRSCPVIRRIMG